MRMIWHNAVYRTEKAKANRDVCGFSQMCYCAGKKPCAFLGDGGKCNKPAEFPRCFEVNEKSGVTHGHVWMRVASDPFRTEFVQHPKADHLCFGCGCLMPGVGSVNTKSEQLKTEGCAHFKLTGTDSDGALKECRVCVVCMMAMLDAGGMLDSGRFKPRYATSRDRKAYLDVLRECQREGVDAAMRHRGLMANGDAEKGAGDGN